MNRKTEALKGTFVLKVNLPKKVKLKSGTEQVRDEFLGRLNDFSSSINSGNDFLGISEGVMLSEEAHDRGYETESWVLDSGMAPHERDWISQEEAITISIYFNSEESAQAAKNWVLHESNLPLVPVIEFEEEQDWNAQWKASFQGIDVDEELKILPPWHEDWIAFKDSFRKSGVQVVAINPGAGFGTGTHETTQLCLKVLNKVAKANGGNLHGKTILDFGSGSGILGITAAKLGATVYCVEIDPLANDNAIENAKLNGVEQNLHISESIPAHLMGPKAGQGQADILLANILRPILIQFAPTILSCLKPNSELILSGLIESDLDQVLSTYQEKRDFKSVEKLEKNEWRAIYFKR